MLPAAVPAVLVPTAYRRARGSAQVRLSARGSVVRYASTVPRHDVLPCTQQQRHGLGLEQWRCDPCPSEARRLRDRPRYSVRRQRMTPLSGKRPFLSRPTVGRQRSTRCPSGSHAGGRPEIRRHGPGESLHGRMRSPWHPERTALRGQSMRLSEPPSGVSDGGDKAVNDA